MNSERFKLLCINKPFHRERTAKKPRDRLLEALFETNEIVDPLAADALSAAAAIGRSSSYDHPDRAVALSHA